MAKPVSTRRSHARLWIVAAVGVLLLAGAVSLGWYLRSPYFADFVRRKLIVTLEDATGGKVDVASFQWKLSELAFQADDVTVHGLEPRDQLPYVHIDRVQVRLRILSFVGRRVNLDQLDLQHPVIHLIVYPDGSTNAPAAKVEPKTTQEAVQDLFDLAVAQADVHDGMLLLNERQVPLDFTANDVVAAMTYNKLAQRYDGSVQVGKADIKYQEFRDVAAQAQMQFSILHNMAEVKSLKITSEQSSIEASAKLTDFNHPQLQVTFNSTIDVAQLGAVSRTNQLRGGTLLLDGTGAYSEAAGDTSQGRIAFRDLYYTDEGLTLRKAGVNANFSLENNRLTLTRIAARVLGGSITGDAEIKNLVALTPGPTPMPPPESKPATKKTGAARSARQTPASAGAAMVPAVQEGSARLRVSGLSLNEVARTLSSRTLPLEKLNPVGSVNGTVNVSWKQSLAETMAELALDVAAPAGAGNQLPVNASLRGRYSVRASSINLYALDARTPHSHVNASGTIGSTSASLKLALDTDSLTEFQPLLAAMGNAPLPIELGGEAKFDGTLQGRLSSPQIAGHLQAANFTYIYTSATKPAATTQPASQAKRRSWLHLTSSTPPPTHAPPVPQPRRIHIDEFSGDLQYSKSGVALHHATVQEGSSQFKLDGSTTLERGDFTPASQFQFQGSTHNADVAELQRVAGFDYPVTGKLSLTVEAAGTQENLHGHAQVTLQDAEAYGRPIKSLSTKAVFTNKSVELEDIHMKAGRGALSGEAAYDFSNRGINFDLNGESMDLDEFPELQHPRLRIEGVADFRAKGSGTLDEPVINGHLQIDKLVLNGDTIGALSADAVTHGRQLKLTARSSFPQATLLLDGEVELRGDMPAQMKLQFTHLNIHPFLPDGIRNRITKEALLDGSAQLSGPFAEDLALHHLGEPAMAFSGVRSSWLICARNRDLATLAASVRCRGLRRRSPWPARARRSARPFRRAPPASPAWSNAGGGRAARNILPPSAPAPPARNCRTFRSARSSARFPP